VDDATVQRELALHDAQFVIAREQGFASWTQLKAYAEPFPNARHTRLFVTDIQWIAERVSGLLRTRQSAGPAALEQIREWHPRFDGWPDEQIRQAPFTEADARLVYAREHGFDSWDDLARRVNLLASVSDAEATEPFLRAFKALQSGDVAALIDHGATVNHKATFGGLTHGQGVTALHMASQKGHLSMVKLLIERRADPSIKDDLHGGDAAGHANFFGQASVRDYLNSLGGRISGI
jgi:broad specificity phosphatase PhoE